jgi:UDP-N-acetylglucosamine--N-acetylmuramyl-(pentapeptide) pyrophosphoryl-undecaprenol N-acetylglucosamine transferase
MSDISEKLSDTTIASLGLIAFTGGGSAGHVTPNLALIENWQAIGGQAMYLGRAQSIEEDLVKKAGIPFFAMPSERLRRYFDWRNFLMPFQVLWGIYIAYQHLKAQKPKALFSKGGFVALPPVIAAWLCGIPILIHESDGSLGLANRLSLAFAKVVCFAQKSAFLSFIKKNLQENQQISHSKTQQDKISLDASLDASLDVSLDASLDASLEISEVQISKKQSVLYVGSPIRRAFYEADPQRAYARYGLEPSRPLILVFGGSQGAARLNEVVKQIRHILLQTDQIIHVCGEKQVDPSLNDEHYHQLEYVHEGFADLLSAARFVICRAGANSIAELMVLRKPAILIPLSTQNSRGDQLLNAQEFKANGYGTYLENENLNEESLLKACHEISDLEMTARIQNAFNQVKSTNQQKIIEKFKKFTM